MCDEERPRRPDGLLRRLVSALEQRRSSGAAGAAVRAAASAADALELLHAPRRAWCPDLLVVHAELPGTSAVSSSAAFGASSARA
jgi:hypothetical protein